MENNPLHSVKAIGFDYRVLTRFTLSGAVYKRLMALSEHHYDGKCKAASRQGGFIFGWGNQMIGDNYDKWKGTEIPDYTQTPAVIPDDWTCEISCSSSELDTAAKIGEAEAYQFRHDPYGITFSFVQLLHAANDEFRRLNNPEGKPL